MKSRLMLEDNAVLGYKGCPNKCNIYHKCTTFCVKRWGDGIKKPTEPYLARQKRLLKKYPLPKHWKEVYDAGFGMHYYWNSKDDTVAWLPPLHPKSEVSKSAANLRKELEETEESRNDDDEKDAPLTISDAQLDEIFSIHRERKRSPSMNSDHMAKKSKPRDDRNTSRRRDDRGRDDRDRNRDDRDKGRDKDRRDDRDRNRDRYRGRDHHRKKAQDEPLDPMDPAAYSDVPRGKWSDGLAPEGEKTAADTTVTGTAFQSRPYPSPGDVLKANAEKNGKSAEDSGPDEDMDEN